MTIGTIINVDGTIKEVDRVWELYDLWEVVGGYIDIVRLSDKFFMYVNDEGLLTGLPINPIASLVAVTSRNDDTTIVGNVVIFSYEMDGSKGSATIDEVLEESGAHFIKKYAYDLNEALGEE